MAVLGPLRRPCLRGLGRCIPTSYHSGMSIQIAVRLPDEQVAYIDSQVAAGRASSRADLITKLLVRERRRQRALDDIETMRTSGYAGNPGLAHIARATSGRALELD